MRPPGSASWIGRAGVSGWFSAPVPAPPSASKIAVRSGGLCPYRCAGLKTSRQIPDSGLPAISVLSQFGKSPPDTGAPSGDYVTTRSDGTISISAMNSYMDDQIPLIIAVGRYSGEVRKSGLTNVVYAVD